jgi:hypothetical protein
MAVMAVTPSRERARLYVGITVMFAGAERRANIGECKPGNATPDFRFQVTYERVDDLSVKLDRSGRTKAISGLHSVSFLRSFTRTLQSCES